MYFTEGEREREKNKTTIYGPIYFGLILMWYIKSNNNAPINGTYCEFFDDTNKKQPQNLNEWKVNMNE